jgi:predicted lipoprotein
MRLLLTTSSASSGSGSRPGGWRVGGLAVAHDVGLAAGHLHLVGQQRLQKAGRAGSAATRPSFSAAMRSSLSPAAMRAACSGVRAWQPRPQSEQQPRNRHHERKGEASS